MNITVKYDSENRKVEVPSAATVLDLMTLIWDAFGLPIENQKLICRGKALSPPDALLSSFGIKADSRILLVGSAAPADSQKSIPPPVAQPPFDFSSRQLRIVSDEYMTAPPHSLIIQKGPPKGAMEGSNYQLDTLPAQPFKVRDSVGDDATLAFRSDDLVVDSDTSHNRLFYQEITSFGIQAIPGYEQKYLAVVFHVKGKKLWVYFVPKQYRQVIELILQHRRA
jgi:hypothetical protein